MFVLCGEILFLDQIINAITWCNDSEVCYVLNVSFSFSICFDPTRRFTLLDLNCLLPDSSYFIFLEM